MKLHASAAALVALLLLSAASAQNCGNTSVGLDPLNDLLGGSYQGVPGGLYPGDTNQLPEPHLIDGLAAAARVVPRDALGVPDPGGQVGVIALGMSNTRIHYQAFRAVAQSDPLRDPRVRVVNTAKGGVPAEQMVDPNHPYWDFVDQTLAQAGVAAPQVQVAWLLQANAGPTDPFPSHALTLRDQLAGILRIARDRFPNLGIAYLGARIYAGYAVTALNPEPWAYEQGFANRWLIAAQMGGDPGLNHDPAAGPVEAPWIAWGPYMWADGLVPRSDGLVWECADFAADGTHPSAQGAAKVGGALLDFVRSEATAATWYRAAPLPAPYGTPKTTSLGVDPHVGWSGSPSALANDFHLTLTGGIPGAAAIGFHGPEPNDAPFFNGTLYVGGPLGRLPVSLLDGGGAASWAIPIGPGMVGDTRFFQVYLRDAGQADGTSASHSEGLAVRFYD